LIDPRDAGWKGGSRPAPGSFGGRPQTGSRTLIIWFQDWFDQAFRQWIQWRPILVAKTGEPDHGMLLVANKGRGGSAGHPFGYRSVDSFFMNVNESLGPFRGDSSAFPFLLSSHREPWTPFLDRLPLVPKCYHASNGAGPEAKPAGGGADNAATGWFCS